MGDEPANTENTDEARSEDAAGHPAAPVTGLNADERVTVTRERRGLADEFRAAGFPGETAALPWKVYESRAVTWSGSVDNINRATAGAGPFGYDRRYAWPAFQTVAVEEGATSVECVHSDRPDARDRGKRRPRDRRSHEQARDGLHCDDCVNGAEAGHDSRVGNPERLPGVPRPQLGGRE